VTTVLLLAIALPLVGVDVGPQVIRRHVAAVRFWRWDFVRAVDTRNDWAASPDGWGADCLSASPWYSHGWYVMEGLIVMRSPGHPPPRVWSVAVALDFTGNLIATSAFGVHLTFVGSFIVVDTLVPTPGGAGGFHYFAKAALIELFRR
jgi:hypothetical protein